MKLSILVPTAAVRADALVDDFAAALSAAAGVTVPVLEGTLADAPADGFVLAYAIGAVVLAGHRDVARRVVLVDVNGATVESNLEQFDLVAAIDWQRYSNWRHARAKETGYGLIGRREVAPAIGAHGYGSYATPRYETMESEHHADLPALLAAYLAAYDRQPPAIVERRPGTRTVDGRRIVVGEAITADAVARLYRGHVAGRPDDRRLITISAPHTEAPSMLRDRLALPVEGVTLLEMIGTVDDPDDSWQGDCMVEVEPDGVPARDLAPLPEPAAIRIARGVAAIAARAHDDGLVLGGIRPELIYVGADGAVTALAPRAIGFIAGTERQTHGIPAFPLIYDRDTMVGLPASAASDVFALCATVFELVTGQHPFGGFGGQLPRLAACDPIAWTGSPALGAVLRRGLVADPARRPTATELAAALAAL